MGSEKRHWVGSGEVWWDAEMDPECLIHPESGCTVGQVGRRGRMRKA